jgi:hypothetical protein
MTAQETVDVMVHDAMSEPLHKNPVSMTNGPPAGDLDCNILP